MIKKTVAAFALSLLMSASSFAGTLKVGHSTWVGYGPFYIALQKGFFKEEGVDVEFVIMILGGEAQDGAMGLAGGAKRTCWRQAGAGRSAVPISRGPGRVPWPRFVTGQIAQPAKPSAITCVSMFQLAKPRQQAPGLLTSGFERTRPRIFVRGNRAF